VILGLVQGITEFLPVSSSGHLVILQNLLGMSEPQVLFDVMLHVGTLMAILVFFRKDIIDLIQSGVKILTTGKLSDQPGERMLAAIVIGSVPTAVIGFLFAKHIEKMFASITAAGVGLIVTGFVLMATTWKGSRMAGEKDAPLNRITFIQAVLIGTAQGIAIIPGISRSGATIAGALILGVPRELAARFSFLLAIPAIVGALALELKDYSPAGHSISTSPTPGAMLSGTLVAAISGIIALTLLLRIVKRGKISLFAYYCWALGLLAVIVGVVRG
jgi:undecaprenyl-diphosphatase